AGGRVAAERAIIGRDNLVHERHLPGGALHRPPEALAHAPLPALVLGGGNGCKNRVDPGFVHLSHPVRHLDPWMWGRASPFASERSAAGQPIHPGGELEIELGETARVVGGEADIHPVVDVRPVGMVVQLLCRERGPCHEAECLAEILEGEATPDRPAILGQRPAIEFPQGGLHGVVGHLLACHRDHRIRCEASWLTARPCCRPFSTPDSVHASSTTYGPPPTESREDISTKRPTRKGAVAKLPRAER